MSRKIMLFDLDGTLCDDRHRVHLYEEGRATDYWRPDLVMADGVWPEAARIYHEALADGWEVGILTARLERNRGVSEAWLREHHFKTDIVYLRPEEYAYMRPPAYKTTIIGSLIRSGDFDQVVHYDNDALVVGRIHETLGEQYAVHTTWDVATEPKV